MRKDQDLIRMAVQICYELHEFRGSLSAELRLDKSDPAYKRTVESVLLHFRNLRCFFFEEPSKRADDVLAKHYVQSWNPNRDKMFDETRNDLNKKLAHLSWKRLTIPRVDWPLRKMQTAINELFDDFIKALTPPRDQWFPCANIAPKGAELPASNSGATASGPPPTSVGR